MKKNNTDAFKLLILPVIFSVIFLSTLSSSFPIYLVGQIFGGIFLAQAFILMHEMGHNSFFNSTFLNKTIGFLLSPLTFIPFFNWYKMHDLHHEWTGWRDKDPTTENTFDDQLSESQVKVVNFCWKYYIPIFSLGYRFGIYWKQEKLKRYLSPGDFQKSQLSIYAYCAFYILFFILNFSLFIKLIPAIYISWMITDLVMLSQHAHIKMPLAGSEEVEPLKYLDQGQYTRSIQLPFNIGKYIFFNFNFHEAHHAYPGLPCYFLPRMKVESQNSYKFMPWLKKVKSMNGVDYIFKSSDNRDGF